MLDVITLLKCIMEQTTLSKCFGGEDGGSRTNEKARTIAEGGERLDK